MKRGDKYIKRSLRFKKFFSMLGKKGTVLFSYLHSRTGRPLGEKTFIDKLENLLGINLKKKKPGPKKKENN
jgi:putative transposase